MITNHIVSSISGVTLFAALGLVFAANAGAYEITAAQRAACTPDAFRFCASAIPNVEAVKTCMIANRAKLSAACLAAFPKEEARR
jgi:hypothetical protein